MKEERCLLSIALFFKSVKQYRGKEYMCLHPHLTEQYGKDHDLI